MSGGGKTSTQETRISKALEKPSREAIARAANVAAVPYTPNRGVTIAGFSPDQIASMQGTNDAAAAFGMPTGQGTYLPPTQTTPDGYQGYSTGGLYDQNLNQSVPKDLQKFIAKDFYREGDKPTKANDIKKQGSGGKGGK